MTGKLLPVDDRRVPVPARRSLTEAEQERVAREVAVALRLPSHHQPKSDPWDDGDHVWWLERVHELRRDLKAAELMLAAVVRHRDLYDPDEVAVDRQDTRDQETAHDETAARNTVRP